MLNLNDQNVKLDDPQALAQTRLDADYLINNWLIGEANDYYNSLYKLLKNNEPIKNKYEEVVVKLGYFTLSLRDDSEVYFLISQKLLTAIRLKIDVTAAIYLRFQYLNDPDFNWPDRDKLLDYLNHNAENLGNDKIIINKQPYDPLIKNWLKDYNITFGIDKYRSGFQEVSYINNNLNSKKLPKNLKDTLLEVLQVYDDVVFPGYRILSGGVDVDTDGRHFIKQSFDNNLQFNTRQQVVQTNINPKTTILETNQTVNTNYELTETQINPYQQIQQLFKNQLATLQQKYQINDSIKQYQASTVPQLIDLLIKNSSNAGIVLGALALLSAKENDLTSLIGNQNIISLTGGAKDVKGVLVGLMSKAGLSEAEMAVYLMHLSKTNKKLLGLAYVEVKSRAFKIKM